MAKRRRLEVPTEDSLKDLETGFARETKSAFGALPPIAQVAADAAAQATPESAEAREEAARDKADAEALRKAVADGLLVQEIPLVEIHADELSRDRMAIDSDEMEELRASILAHGLRMPIEVYPLPTPGPNIKYGLISGWRRLAAYRQLLAETDDAKYKVIRAIKRTPANAADAYVAMVEENEIRANLSHYERGRIAVMAVQAAAFSNVEDAVAQLFHAGSKAKRSKIRGFAELHEELGDLLVFPTALNERQGLKLIGALRSGFAREMRAALATGQGVDPQSEWELLEPFTITQDERAPARQLVKTARPRVERADEVHLANGVVMRREHDGKSHLIRLEGKVVDVMMVEEVMAAVKHLLEPS
ncbi:MAG: ParB N-terminal domain-containing protein [Pseudomonadota bacterium]